MAIPADLTKNIVIECLDGTKIPVGKDGDIVEFKYMEDMNLGFPIVELTVAETALQKINEHIQGSEIIKIVKVKYNEFEINNMDLRVKAFGIGTPTGNKFGGANTIKFIAHHIDQEKLMNFDKGIHSGDVTKPKIISELVQLAYDSAGVKLKPDVEPTEPLPKKGWWNLYIPYSANIMKVVRKLSYLAMSGSGKGAYVYYHNKDKWVFKPMEKVMGDYFKNKEINIYEGRNDYNMREIVISPFNDFQTMSLGNIKDIYGWNYREKLFWRYGWDSDELKYKMTDKMMPLKITNATKCLRPYHTPLDERKWMKSFAESIYVSQMFNINMDLAFETTETAPGLSNDFRVGDVIPVTFKVTDVPQTPYYNMSGRWLIKSNTFQFTDFNVTQSLKLTKAGFKPPHPGDYTPA